VKYALFFRRMIKDGGRSFFGRIGKRTAMKSKSSKAKKEGETRQADPIGNLHGRN